MASKLGIYNATFLHLGERSIAALEEEAEGKRDLDEIYDEGVLYCLHQGLWNFAARTIEGSVVASIEPPFGLRFAYTKPEDWVRTMGVSSDPMFYEPYLDYIDEQEYWYAGIQPLYFRYVSSDPEYGLNLGKWPPTFTEYVSAHFASKLAMRISNNRQLRSDMFSMMEALLRRCKDKDAMDEPSKFPPPGRWVRSRSSGARTNSSSRGL